MLRKVERDTSGAISCAQRGERGLSWTARTTWLASSRNCRRSPPSDTNPPHRLILIVAPQPGLVCRIAGALQTTAVEIEDGGFTRIFVTRRRSARRPMRHGRKSA
jgi:hypothetical protein